MKIKLTWLYYSAIITVVSLFAACDGADIEQVKDDYCVFIPQLVSVVGEDPEASCTVTFLFIDEDGVEYGFNWETDSEETLPLMGLPKNKCYNGWILDIGTGVCGYITFGIGGLTDEGEYDECMQITEFVDDRGDVYDDSLPEFTFCLDDVCTCPEGIDPNEHIQPCPVEYEYVPLTNGCDHCPIVDSEQVFADWAEGYSVAPGINIANCGELSRVFVVWVHPNDGLPFLWKGIAGNDLCTQIPCGWNSEVYLQYETELCGDVTICVEDVVCNC